MGSVEAAEVRMLEAQQSVVRLREQLGVVSADVELSSRMEQIGVVETELREQVSASSRVTQLQRRAVYIGTGVASEPALRHPRRQTSRGTI